MKNRNAAATWLKGLRVFFNQVYFKASAADGSWTTYFKSFVPEGWYVFGATVAVTMTGRLLCELLLDVDKSIFR